MSVVCTKIAIDGFDYNLEAIDQSRNELFETPGRNNV